MPSLKITAKVVDADGNIIAGPWGVLANVSENRDEWPEHVREHGSELAGIGERMGCYQQPVTVA